MTNDPYFHSLRQCEQAFLYYLYASGAKHVVIGSHAVLLYAGDREAAVNDLDVVVECSKENAVKVYAAVQACGARPVDGEADCMDRLSQPNTILRLNFGGPIEVMTSTKSEVLLFDDLWRDRYLVRVSVAVGDLGDVSVFKAPFVSKTHLIQLKQEAIKDPARKEKWEQDKMDLVDLLRSP